MITGKKNLFIAALEVVAVGVCLKIGYHLGNKLVEKIEGTGHQKKKAQDKENEGVGGRKRVVEDMTDNQLALLP